VAPLITVIEGIASGLSVIMIAGGFRWVRSVDKRLTLIEVKLGIRT
jgi:hypothetical protein